MSARAPVKGPRTMKPRLGALRSLAAGLLALGGCSTGAWRDRAHDFAQILDASVTVGPGVAASVRVTELAQLGFGSFDGYAAGLQEGRLATCREQRDELGVSLLHTYEYRRDGTSLLDVRHPYFADPGYERHPLSWQQESDRQDVDVGLGLHIAYIGGNVAIHFSELWDALAGCIGFDPAGDDAHGRSLEEVQRQALSLDSAKRRAAFDALLRRDAETHGYPVWTAPDVMPSAQKRARDAVQAELAAAPAQQ